MSMTDVKCISLNCLQTVEVNAMLEKAVKEGEVHGGQIGDLTRLILKFMAVKPKTFFPRPIILPHPEMVSFFLQCGAYVDALDDEHSPLVHYAICVNLTPARMFIWFAAL
jgi:hypothetical protein